ncbi:AARA-like protein [Mya arenaria]|uniref:AARA-like protein n=1 Tax=Mya arenaria TaxID=6604 RepID=A0ABY7E995_MYAAR|nr:AARA-like protein [Mya arenaria]
MCLLLCRRRSPKKTSLERCNPGDSHTVRCECGLEISVKCEWGSAISSTSGTPVLPACSPNKETSEASERRKSTSLISTIERLETGNADLEFVIASCRELGHVEHQEASLHYLCVNEGIERLHHNMKTFGEDTDLLIVVLDIFGYYSFQDEWRCILTEKVQPSEILRTMACHEGDPNVVEKCCIVLENLALSEDIARSMMYVGGVHSILSMMSRYDKHVDVLKHCCTTLGTFASHDDTCQAVSEAGATSAVMLAMTSYITYPEIQQSCCWALASLSRAAPELEEDACRSALVLLLDSTQMFMANVELLEHVCYAISTLVAVRECVHVNVVKNDGISKLIELMKRYDDNVDIQLHSCKVIGNLAVNDNFRRYVEDMGASEAIISCMLGLEKNALIQSTGCMTLTNISAKDKGCWWIAEESGISVIAMSLRNFPNCPEIMAFGCSCLANLPRRGMNTVALGSAESSLLYLRQQHSLSTEVALALCAFYENALKAGTECGKLVTSVAMETMTQIMQDFEDIEIQVTGCQIMAQVVLDSVRGSNIQNVCDAVSKSMKAHGDNNEIQLGGCHILSIIGSGFHRQNVQKRESVDFMGPLVTVTHRKSVTEELLDVASAAIHRLRKFTDGVLDDTEEGDSDASQTESTSDGVPIDNVYQ